MDAGPDEHGAIVPGAVALHLSGAPAISLLDGEQGTHRFQVAGESRFIKVFFEPRRVKDLPDPVVLDSRPAPPEVRRVTASRRQVEDLRTGARDDASEEGLCISRLVRAWMRTRLLGAEETE